MTTSATAETASGVPAARVKRARGRSRTSRFARSIAIAAALSLVAVGTVTATSNDAAWAVDYPSWNDVVKARTSEAATKAAISRIESLIAGLEADVARTQAAAEAKGEIYFEADQKFQEAAVKADELQAQADDASALAEESKRRAGELIARQFRSGNGDVTTTLFVNAAQADDLLYSYGMADKFTELTAGIYVKAVQDQNTAQALTDQADVAKVLLQELSDAAERAFAEAQTAAQKAADAVEAQQANLNQLSAQLDVLRDRRKATEADYLKGVRARIAAAAQLGAGEISSSGWAKPVTGYISSNYGYRVHPRTGNWAFHAGVDLAAPCGRNIYAPYSGTVVYAGWNGGYGNYLRIDHGNGLTTAYGHIITGGTLVKQGQAVVVGQNIARVGTTGASTGCHLHYEVRSNGITTNPVTFMRDKGITLG
jgi:murein DD-endopeptidase MepM/ murein hydrolase activator NlpD